MRRQCLPLVMAVRRSPDWAPALLAAMLVLIMTAIVAILCRRLVINLFLRVPGSRRAFFCSFAEEVGRPPRCSWW